MSFLLPELLKVAVCSALLRKYLARVYKFVYKIIDTFDHSTVPASSRSLRLAMKGDIGTASHMPTGAQRRGGSSGTAPPS